MSGVILLGGGIDSTSLLVWLRKTSPELALSALHVNYGQKAFDSECHANYYFCTKYDVSLKHTRVQLGDIASSSILLGADMGREQIENRLEGRNITLISLAATYASTIGADRVFVGFHKEPTEAPFPDATFTAYANMYIVLRTAYKPALFLEAPFIKKTRLEVFETGLLLDYEIATKTFTCYEGGIEECGVCVHCQTKAAMVAKIEAKKRLSWQPDSTL